MRRMAVLSGLVLVGGLLGPSAALAGEDDRDQVQGDRWIAVQDLFTVVLPDGTTFSGDSGEEPAEFPPPGTQLFISEVLHETEDGATPGAEVGRSHIECTAQAVEANFLCSAAFVFGPDSQLELSVLIDFSAAGPETVEVAVTGGTGDWFGATGAVSMTDVSSSPDQTVTLYEADVVFPRDP